MACREGNVESALLLATAVVVEGSNPFNNSSTTTTPPTVAESLSRIQSLLATHCSTNNNPNPNNNNVCNTNMENSSEKLTQSSIANNINTSTSIALSTPPFVSMKNKFVPWNSVPNLKRVTINYIGLNVGDRWGTLITIMLMTIGRQTRQIIQ